MRLTLRILATLGLIAFGSTSPALLAQQAQTGVTAAKQVNAIRADANVPRITRNRSLDAAAKAHATDMSAKNFFGHNGSNGSTVGLRVEAVGYRWCNVSENISKGYSAQSAAIESWRKSPGHYRNLTNRKAREFGIAKVGNYWVMVLAAKGC